MIDLRTLTLHNFAVKLGYPSALDSDFREYLEFLKQTGAVRVQQSGYSGHSLAHSKVVASDLDFEELYHFKKDAPEYAQSRTLYCCPHCGRALDICRTVKNSWSVFGSVFKVHLVCSCSGKFDLYISDESTLRELRKALPFVKAMLRKKRRVSIYDEFQV